MTDRQGWRQVDGPALSHGAPVPPQRDHGPWREARAAVALQETRGEHALEDLEDLHVGTNVFDTGVLNWRTHALMVASQVAVHYWPLVAH